jgi:hypothetical protein
MRGSSADRKEKPGKARPFQRKLRVAFAPFTQKLRQRPTLRHVALELTNSGQVANKRANQAVGSSVQAPLARCSATGRIKQQTRAGIFELRSAWRRSQHETHISTEQTGAQTPSRFSLAHGDQGRTQGHRHASRTGTQAPVGLNVRVNRSA